MIDLTKKAEEFASEKMNEVLAKAFASVYADGYRAGYKDGKEEILVNLQEGKTEYVDLGLPSGTLWASDYETEDGNILFLPYEVAITYDIPTRDQWEELKKFAKWDFQIDEKHNSLVTIKCIGPNGNALFFNETGKMDFVNKYVTDWTFFWIKDDIISKPYTTVRMWLYNHEGHESVDIEQPQIKIPLRLVKSK